MPERSVGPDGETVSAALAKAGFGVGLLDCELRLADRAGPLANLLPDLQGRLDVGADWTELIATTTSTAQPFEGAELGRSASVMTTSHPRDDGGTPMLFRAETGPRNEPHLSDVIEGGTLATPGWAGGLWRIAGLRYAPPLGQLSG